MHFMQVSKHGDHTLFKYPTIAKTEDFLRGLEIIFFTFRLFYLRKMLK